eukprot:PhF_6_TR10550/c0_g1_i2/m.16730
MGTAHLLKQQNVLWDRPAPVVYATLFTPLHCVNLGMAVPVRIVCSATVHRERRPLVTTGLGVVGRNVTSYTRKLSSCANLGMTALAWIVGFATVKRAQRLLVATRQRVLVRSAVSCTHPKSSLPRARVSLTINAHVSIVFLSMGSREH